jgi:hypothetical protein
MRIENKFNYLFCLLEVVRGVLKPAYRDYETT